MSAEKFDSKRQFGVEIRKEWCDQIFSGRKKMETRRYPLPPGLLHKKIWVVQTEGGPSGTSSLPDTVSPGDKNAELVGIITFRSSSRYSDVGQWELERHLHCVDSSSAYDWDGQGEMFGWFIEAATQFEERVQVPGMTRLHRSLFVFNHA